jgi:hypothetical protein
MYKGKITITHQAGKFLIDEILTPKNYKNKSSAIMAAKKLSSKIESHYSIYSNYDYSTIVL